MANTTSYFNDDYSTSSNAFRIIRMMFLLALWWLMCATSTSAIQLSTQAKSPLSAVALHDFLARPVHWPQIVTSSNGVANSDPNAPLVPGQSVEEFFGLGLLSITWTCQTTKPGSLLVVESPDGVPGIAKDCRMRFVINDNQVTLTMDYQPVSPLAVFATPVLMVDNWIALHVLLPAAVDPHPLVTFRKLMGTLYGVAGVAHAVDLWIGESTLLTSNGIPAWADLPPAGQVVAASWCAVGPLAWWTTSQQASGRINDLGLVIYGLVEILAAYLTGNGQVLTGAVSVQAMVAAAWLYSLQKKRKENLELTR